MWVSHASAGPSLTYRAHMTDPSPGYVLDDPCVRRVATSLVFRAHRDDDTIRPLLVIASGAHRVDSLRLADLLELRSISLADAEFVSKQTGFAIGGVAPIALNHPIETVVDVSLSRYAQVWAAAGHPRTVFPTSYDELLRLTRGHPAEVA